MGKGDYMNKAVFKKRLLEVASPDNQTTIAEKLYREPRDITEWCSDKYSRVPSVDDLIQISKVYMCSIDYLLGGDAPEPETEDEIIDQLVLLDMQHEILEERLSVVQQKALADKVMAHHKQWSSDYASWFRSTYIDPKQDKEADPD